MKKAISVILALVLAFGMLITAGAADTNAETKLQFGNDGNFRIMQISDIQDGTLLTPATKKFIKEVVIDAQPDLIVLTGDNISAGSATLGTEAVDKLLVKTAINNYMSVLEEIGIPVAVTFGNHDAEEKVSKEYQMEVYTSYDCCVAIDEGDALYGCGTYNLPIYSSDGSKISYNLWMIDSNMYDDVNGGYDHVHQDQLDWYVKTSNELKAQNGGKVVPSMMFQHIIVNEIYDVIFEVSEKEKDNYEYVEFKDDEGNKKYNAFRNEYLKTGVLNENPCPPSVNGGQFNTVVNQGDVVAMFFGHDHKNTFEVSYKGVDLVNTPTAGFGSYGDYGRGVRIIDINENTTEYKTEIIEYVDFYADNQAMLAQYDLYANESSVGQVLAAFFKTIWYTIINLF
ncbi:MAG: metallophosphoesterase family protein [Acutalibacteraceae bacterium]|nr:metallophosphoesterase family protein [Acutalibacteraceae bacterium]